ncbi:MAG: asparagine synthase C-terminal domain-containing protein [Minisyncoccia bacterium]
MSENIDIIVEKLITLLKGSFEGLKGVIKDEKAGIIVSGGLDSSIIAHLSDTYLKDSFYLSLAGKDSLDKPFLDILSNHLSHKIEIVDPQSFLKEDVDIVKEILEKKGIETNLMQMSLGLGFYLLASYAKKVGLKYILTGQGADEIFGGYTRYKNYEGDLKEYLKSDYEQIGRIDYKRDRAILNHFNIELINPYEEKQFLEYALLIPPELKLYKQNETIIEKYVLRLVAQKLGLPEEIVWRPKKAFQYSSRIQKILAAYLGIKI